MKKVVLLTTAFPYGTGENFIPAELNSLPDGIKLDVVPFLYKKNDEKRNVTEKVNVIDDCRVAGNKLSVIINTMRVLLNSDFWQEVKKDKSMSFKSFRQKLGFYGRAIELYRKLRKRYVFELKEKSVTFYSYWLLEGAYAASLLEKEYGVNACSRAHGVDVWNGMSAYGVVPARQASLANLRSVYVCSQDGKKYLQQQNSRYADKFKVGYLGTQDYGWMPGDNRGKEFVIVSCARIEPVKRVELLAGAIKRIKDTKIHWIHFGDGSCRRAVDEAILNLPKNVRVTIMGTTPHDDVMAYYCKNPVNLFVNTSSSEGLPVSIMEVLSFGIPVVATDVGGTREIVNDFTGTLIPSDFTEEYLTQVIRTYMNQRGDIYAEKRAAARGFWEDYFAAKINYKKFYETITRENSHVV